ncbi:IS66 family transposase [Actinokineospora sp.]|uniref:IS66 family transposase n=1 Tax=Actinokineospora sp. TaxID=1872133 RepID=UPI003D6AED30
MVLAQAAVIEGLEARVGELERQIGRHSGNSSLPPSRDAQEQRESRAERRRAARAAQKEDKRRQGKQPGAPGAHLAQVDDPDRVVVHVPGACRGCGAGLAGAPVEGVERRQVFDLPERRREVTEHRAERRRCGCGRATTAEFPPEARAPACWGPRVRAYAIYLLVRQHLPVERTAELLADMLGAPVSSGWLASLAAEGADGLAGFVDDLADRVAASDVVHADETGTRVAGTKWWIHVAATVLLTYLAVHRHRGREAINEIGILPRFRGTLVHDRLASYWGYTNARHAVCNAHLLRDLAAVAEIASQEAWATAMTALLLDAKRRCEAALAAGLPAVPPGQRSQLRARYNRIVADAFAVNPEPPAGRKRHPLERAGYNLAVAFRNHATEILRFTTDLRVPFDNNQAERDLRMAKLQQKISGTFRSEKGAERFAAIRSYIETGRKHGHNPLDLLIQLFNGNPWMIPSPAAT